MSFGLAWVGLLAAAAGSAPQGASADDCSARAQGAGFPRVLRAGLVAPAMLAIVVQDAEVVAGALEPYAARDGDRLDGDWIWRGDQLHGRVTGAHADTLASVRHVQRASCFVGRRLDRRSLDDPAAYRVESEGREPPALRKIWRKSLPFGVSETQEQTESPFQHTLILEFGRRIQPGEVLSLSLPDGLGGVRFENDGRRNRSEAIHVNQHGWRAGDPSKRGFLALWLPGGPDYGMFDLGAALAEAGTRSFEILDASLQPVFRGPIALRKSPRRVDSEGRWDYYESLHDGSAEILYDYDPASSIQPPDAEFWQVREPGETGVPVRKVRLNPSKTYVYELDFSAWRAAPGSYRVHVPGLGTSFPFEIREDAWEDVFRVSMAGLYHQRSGIALDGRYGYTRPRDGHPDDGVLMTASDLPLMIGREGLLGDGPSIEVAGSAEHASGRRAPAVWGGYMDAGDWDRRIQHAFVTHALFDLFELFPDYFSRLSLQLPESRTLLPDPAYRGFDLPDLLDEAVWNLDFFRRLQRADGAVPGGVENRDPIAAPSWLQTGGLFVYQPDAWSSYLYAAMAAKGALVLGAFSEPLASLYRRSALAAWTWAEAHRSDPAPFAQLGDFLRQSYGPDGRAAAEARLAGARGEIDAALRDARSWAGAALFRLTGEGRFLEAFAESSALAGAESPAELRGEQILAHWEFVLAGKRQHPLWRASVDSLVLTARDRYVHPNLEHYAYANLRHNWTLLGWGVGVVPTPDSLVVLRAHVLDPEKRDYRKALVDGLAFVLGGNQANLSLTLGIGDESVAFPLHEDSRRSGVRPPKGITVYGFRSPSRNFSWLFDNPDWSDLYDRFYYDPAAPRDDRRAIYPDKTTWPAWENAFQHPENIESMEYTVHQTIATMAALSGYLSALQGDRAPALPPARYASPVSKRPPAALELR